MYAAADRILGRPVKVTPSSKVVGDLALHLVAVGRRPGGLRGEPAGYDIPDSVIGFLGGELGDPPGGWPEPFRTKALQGRTAPSPRRRTVGEDDSAALDEGTVRQATLNRLLFPGPTKEFERSRETYGDVVGAGHPGLPLRAAAGRGARRRARAGRQLIIGLEAIGEPDERGMRTVMCTINGQLRPIRVRDRRSGRRQGGGEGRPGQAGPRRGALRRSRDRCRGRGRRGRGRRHGRHHRGDEDGGRDHCARWPGR